MIMLGSYNDLADKYIHVIVIMIEDESTYS